MRPRTGAHRVRGSPARKLFARAEGGAIDLQTQTLFISRSGADADVAAEIGRVLKSAGYGVILQQWDFANRHFMERMHEALSSGARVMALLSPDYLRSDHCQAEWMNAIADDPLNRNRRLILLRVAECEPPGLLAGLSYWDLIPIRDNPALLAEVVCTAVSDDQRETVPLAASYRRDPQRRAASPQPVRTNLPAEVKSFIGREAEVAEIRELFEHARLVTLVGVGGVGKTSCSLKAVAGLIATYADGVWFVDFAPITDPTLVAAEVAGVFQLVESTKGPILDALTAYLRNKQTLILLDNCEHLLDACSRLAAALLRACPGVSLLATSREALKVGGERVYYLPTLAVPERSAALTVDEALGYSAIALFAARAHAADSRFELTPQNTASVAEICRRLDGIPLALELAAARVRVLAPQQLAKKLDERFRILTGGSRTALPRQQTMRALIDWSYDLLDGREQALLSALSIFAGSFSLEAATAVCVSDDLEDFEVLDGLTSLVDKSLVVSEFSESDARYRLLESMRQYARERLDERGSHAEIARRHAVAYTEFAERLEDEYGSTRYRTWVASAEREIENIRAALTWLFGPQGDVAVGLRLAATLRRIFNTSQPAEARRWIQTALGRVTADSPPRVVARLELADAHLASSLNQLNAALAAARRALAGFEADGDQRGVANAKRWAGRSLIFLGAVSEGETLLCSALDTYETLGFRKTGGLFLDLGSARSACGDIAGARDFFARALKQFEEDGDEGNVAITAGTLAEAEFHGGDAQAAVRRAQDALAAARHLSRPITVWIQSNMAGFLIALDRFDQARQYAQEALQTALHLQSEFWVIVLLQHIAATLVLESNAKPAAAATKESELAAHLVGYVDKRMREIDLKREFTEQQEYDRILAVLSGALGVEPLAALMADGATLKEERAVELAVTATSTPSQKADSVIETM